MHNIKFSYKIFVRLIAINMQKTVTDKYSSANLVLKQKEQQGPLLIGDCNSAVDKHILKPYKIQTVLTLGQDSSPQKKQEGIKYVLHNVLDNKSQKISDMFDSIFQEIQQGRKIGGVLVHCYTGISRSASFVIAYLMRKKIMSYDDARAFVKKQRSVAHPNDNFHRQLQGYWKVLQKRQEDEKLRKQKAEEEKKEKEVENQSSVLSSNMSNLSKRTFRGVKGAVKCAIKEQQIGEQKQIEQKAQKLGEQKQGESSNSRQNQQVEKVEMKIKVEQKNKQVKNVYGHKTKVM